MRKSKIKKAPLIVFLIVFIAIVAGLLKFYSSGIPNAITPTQMRDVLIEKGFTPVEAIDNADENMINAGLQDCIIAEQNDMKIEFYNFDNANGALRTYREAYRHIILTKMAAPRIQIKTGKFNYKFYSLDTDGIYTVTIYVKNTAIYAYCNSENKGNLNSILEEIGYVEVKN